MEKIKNEIGLKNEYFIFDARKKNCGIIYPCGSGYLVPMDTSYCTLEMIDFSARFYFQILPKIREMDSVA